MTNQNFGKFQDKPDLFDERDEDDIAEDEQDISAELYPAPPAPPDPDQEKNSSVQIMGRTDEVKPNGASGTWVGEREDSNEKPNFVTPGSAATEAFPTTVNWPGLDGDGRQRLQTHWNEIQGVFVDNPREAVQQAEALVTEVVEKTNALIENEKHALEKVWKQDQTPSTEDLRQALQRYRSIFNHLISKS